MRFEDKQCINEMERIGGVDFSHWDDSIGSLLEK